MVKINVRIPLALEMLLDARRASRQKRQPGRKVTRSELLREALVRYLK